MTAKIDEATQDEAAEGPEDGERGLAPVADEEPEADLQGEQGLESNDEGAAVSEVEELRAEIDRLHDELLRRRAEFDNFRKRTDKQRAELRDLTAAEVLKSLLPTVDNLERAAAASGDESSVREGLGLIMKELQGFLERHRVIADDPVEQDFDPERHQALSHEEVSGYSDGQIVEVFQKGYSLGERLLRPALVRVAKGDDDEGGPGAETPDEAGSE